MSKIHTRLKFRLVRISGNFLPCDNSPKAYPIARIPRPNQLYVILSLALVLFLLGIMGLWTLQAQLLTQSLQEELDIVIELDENRPKQFSKELMLQLQLAPYAHPTLAPEYISKEQALEEMGEDMRQDIEELDLNNPLLDIITFHVPVDYLHPDSLAAIAAGLQLQAGVSAVYYQDNFIERISKNAGKMGWILLSLAVLFAFIAALLIHNTVRLSLYANRFIIKTQELLGASWGFISRPYLWRAFWQGMFSGLLAAGGVYGIQYWLQTQLPELRLFTEPILMLYLYGGIVLTGVLITLISNYIVVRRYLRLRVDDLY